MHVVEIEIPDDQSRYVVINEAGELVELIVRYLKCLDCIGSARLTLRSYAYSLMQYWESLAQQHLDWQQRTLDDLSLFVFWFKLPSRLLKVLPAHPLLQAHSTGPLIMPSRWHGALTTTTGGWKRTSRTSRAQLLSIFQLTPDDTKHS